MDHVILVEDDPDDIYFFKEVVKNSQLNIRLTIFEDGGELYEFLLKNPSKQYLVLLDLNMPRLSGLETLKKLNNYSLEKNNIIIAYTTSNYKSDLEEAYQLGVKSFIVKPDNQKDLSELIETLLQYWFKWNRLPGTD